MSTFICTHDHINAIVRWANDHNVNPHYKQISGRMITLSPQEMTGVLYTANVLSVNYRYRKNEPVGEITYTPGVHLLPVEVFKLCNCLDYQSREHPSWKDSLAKPLLDEIRRVAITKLPGYEAAPWSI